MAVLQRGTGNPPTQDKDLASLPPSMASALLSKHRPRCRVFGRNRSWRNLVVSTLQVRSASCVKWRPPKKDGPSCNSRCHFPSLILCPWSLHAFLVCPSGATHQMVVHFEQHAADKLSKCDRASVDRWFLVDRILTEEAGVLKNIDTYKYVYTYSSRTLPLSIGRQFVIASHTQTPFRVWLKRSSRFAACAVLCHFAKQSSSQAHLISHAQCTWLDGILFPPPHRDTFLTLSFTSIRTTVESLGAIQATARVIGVFESIH